MVLLGWGNRSLLWSRLWGDRGAWALRKRGELAGEGHGFRRGQRLGYQSMYYMVKNLGRAAVMDNGGFPIESGILLPVG
jgi:hypothetical protein